MSYEREDKLPKWARDELFQLRARIRELEEDVSILRGEPGRESKCKGFYSADFTKNGFEYTPLNFEGNDLVFLDGEDRKLQLSSFVVDGKKYLEIMGTNYKGSSGIIARPWASNVILVRVGDE